MMTLPSRAQDSAQVAGRAQGNTQVALRAQGGGQAPVFSSFKSLWDRVRVDNPSQQIYALNTRKAGIDRRTATSELLPNLAAGATGQDNLFLPVTPVPGELVGRPGTTYYVQFGKHYTYSAGFSANQPIFNWTSVFDVKIAAGNVLLNRAQAAYFEQTLKEQAAHYYYAFLVSKASLGVAREDEILADSLVALAQSRLDQGLSDASVLNQARINAEEVRVNLGQSRQLFDQAVDNLRGLLGWGPGDSLFISDTLLLREEPQVWNITLGPDKNLEVYRRQLQTADLERRQRVAAFFPTLSFNGYYGFQQFQDDWGLAGAWNNYSYIGLSLNVPLFTGFANTSRWKSAGLSEKISALQYDNARIQSALNDDLLQRQYADYLAMTRASRKGFLLYGENLELSRQKFSEGLMAMDAYLKIFQDYLNAENTYLNNISNLLSTQASILARNDAL